MNYLRARWTGLAAVILVLSLLELGSRYGVYDSELFPPVSQVIGRAIQLLQDPRFLSQDLGPSLRRLALASFFVVPLAVALGFFSGYKQGVQTVLAPFVNFLYPLPKVALFPLILAVFGLGDLGKIAMIAIGMFFPMLFIIHAGTVRLNRLAIMDLVPVYKISGFNLYYRIYARGLVADLTVGLKTSIGYGFTLMVVSEMNASNNGVGYYIWRAWDSSDILGLYAGILILCFLGWIVQTGLDQIGASQTARRGLIQRFDS